jgi:asparagine synthetase B (glutamine-hydrolysing)
LNYFLVQAPVNYLSLDRPSEWDDSLQEMIEKTASNCGQDYAGLSYEAKTTIRQLFYVNSARWASKALSVGESLGRRVVYPFLWHDVLIEQGKLPWSAKVHEGIVKWPLKRLIEEFMPSEFIYRPKSGFVPPLVRWLTDPEFNDKVRATLLSPKAYVPEIIPSRILEELLNDARQGKRLRFPILNMLWGAIFTESWLKSLRI